MNGMQVNLHFRGNAPQVPWCEAAVPMAKNDREHFETYREQTRAKHEILEKYLYAYFNILKGGNRNLVYIDGFAGRGTYGEEDAGDMFYGSPLRALTKIAQLDDLAQKVSTIFIEKDQILAAHLAAKVSAFRRRHPQIREPKVLVGTFADQLQNGLDELERQGKRLAPTFLFVDPCGVAGASFAAIKRFLLHDSCEVLIFLNMDGVRRILGLGKRMRTTVPELLGSEEHASALLAEVSSRTTPAEKEAAIVAFYENLFRVETPAQYVTMFRFEKEDQQATSHYLVHATRQQIGFRIMKEVMWGVGRTVNGRGGLTFEQASNGGSRELFCEQSEAIKRSILDELSRGPLRARHFYETLSETFGNQLCAPPYRKALLELEASGDIVVLNKSGVGIAPKRKPNTLAKDYYVQRVPRKP